MIYELRGLIYDLWGSSLRSSVPILRPRPRLLHLSRLPHLLRLSRSIVNHTS